VINSFNSPTYLTSARTPQMQHRRSLRFVNIHDHLLISGVQVPGVPPPLCLTRTDDMYGVPLWQRLLVYIKELVETVAPGLGQFLGVF